MADDALPRGEAFEALVRAGCELAPQYATDIAAAECRLRAVLASRDGARVDEGARALADWIDARVGAAVYAHVYSR